jgi:hypothetical protein
MSENESVNKYSSAELKRLWDLKYEELALAPGEPKVGMTQARFILQVRTTLEAHRSQVAMVRATVVMALATVVMTVATVVIAMKP